MATERGGLFASSLVGALWGLGHTISLMLAGVLVIVFHFEIGERGCEALERTPPCSSGWVRELCSSRSARRSS